MIENEEGDEYLSDELFSFRNLLNFMQVIRCCEDIYELQNYFKDKVTILYTLHFNRVSDEQKHIL